MVPKTEEVEAIDYRTRRMIAGLASLSAGVDASLLLNGLSCSCSPRGGRFQCSVDHKKAPTKSKNISTTSF